MIQSGFFGAVIGQGHPVGARQLSVGRQHIGNRHTVFSAGIFRIINIGYSRLCPRLVTEQKIRNQTEEHGCMHLEKKNHLDVSY